MRLDASSWNESEAEVPGGALTSREPAHQAIVAGCLTRTLGAPLAATAAETLLRRFGSLSGVFGASAEALASAPGLNADAADDLLRLHRLAVALVAAEVAPGSVIGSWTALLAYVGAALRHERREHFRVLFLDLRNQLIRDETQGLGSVDHAPVYPREVLRRALELSASSLILVHNHPTGDPTPSRADIEITRQIVDGGRALKIAVHDHLVVGRDRVASFKSLGLL